MTSHNAPPPETLGPYRVEEKIGSGGMGAVYRAWDMRLQRAVALKRVPHGDERSHQRLLREARASARLSHPNIVQIFDFVEHDGVDWIVMELVEGQTLRHVLKDGPLEVRLALAFAMDVAKGLAAAHHQGIVHRDLKTENVMVAADGSAKILDFGLAKSQGFDTDVSWSDGRIQGTPRSMAPEQTMGQPVDHRADLFAFGVLLYECLAGHSPFSLGVRGVYQTLWRVCTLQQQSLRDLVPSIPEDLSTLVDRLLEKEPENRPQSAEEVLLALQRAGDSAPPKLRVLFVDDEPDFEPLIRQCLRVLWQNLDSIDLVFARDGVEAFETLNQDPTIQLLFTDLNMPRMDGLELLGAVTRLNRPLVAVVISAYGDVDNIRRAMNLGAFDFLTKPIDFSDLGKTLEKSAGQLASLRESQRLRAENQLLDERNRVIRFAMSRYLSGDPELRELMDPFVERARPSPEQTTLLSFEIGGYGDLVRLDSIRLLGLIDGLLSDMLITIRRHHGVVLGFETGRLRVAFEVLRDGPAEEDRAKHCAAEIVELVQKLSAASRKAGGPALSSKAVVDDQGLMIDHDSGTLADQAKSRSLHLLDACPEDEILLSTTHR